MKKARQPWRKDISTREGNITGGKGPTRSGVMGKNMVLDPARSKQSDLSSIPTVEKKGEKD